MREALAGSEFVDEAPSPREIGEDDTGLGRHERGTERPEDPVERCGIRSCCAGKVTRLTKSSTLRWAAWLRWSLRNRSPDCGRKAP